MSRQKSIFLQCDGKNVECLNTGDKGSVQMQGGLCFIDNRVSQPVQHKPSKLSDSVLHETSGLFVLKNCSQGLDQRLKNSKNMGLINLLSLKTYLQKVQISKLLNRTRGHVDLISGF